MRIRFTKLADEDLEQAYEYIVQDSPLNARLVMERIENAITMLCQYPSAGKKGRLRGTREFVVVNTPFVVIYRSVKEELQILSILHTSKKYPYPLTGD